jgi:hypothetical protein
MFQKEKRKRGRYLQTAEKESIEIKQERTSHFPIVQNLICGLNHTHISFAFELSSFPWLFSFLPPPPTPTTTPLSINHDYLPHKLFGIFLCFYNMQSVASVLFDSEPPQKILAERKRVIGRMSDWVIKLEKVKTR